MDSNHPPKLYLRTFGCQMNEYDSAKMQDVLHTAQGMEITDKPEEADVILFNTCSVREKAQEKVFSDLGRVKELKQAKPHLLIGVGGCVASQEGEAIVRRAPYVDLVFGPQTLHRLPALIAERRRTGQAQVDIQFPEIEKFDHLPPARVEGASAFVSIMEGCSKFCSFCVVPYTRGTEISRPAVDVLREVAELAAGGVKEVTLLGQNVNAYLDEAESLDFTGLLELVDQIEGIERIRFTTSHPREFGPRLCEAFGRLPRLASYVHLPVQSGSDRILSAMKRGYTALEFKSIIRRLREARPGVALSTDFIVGFPGETDDDHARTLQLAQDCGFDSAFIFIYSPRPGTPAAALPDDTPHEVKVRRLQELQAIIDAQGQAFAQALVGTQQPVLIEGPSRKNPEELMGRTPDNRIVNFAGDPSWVGQIRSLTITQAYPHSLRGEAPALAQP